jgi:hypothetical protein
VLFLDFECKNLFAGNKKSYLLRIVDFNKISQVVCSNSFLSCGDGMESNLILCFSSHHVRMFHRAMFLKIFYNVKLIICWIGLLKT